MALEIRTYNGPSGILRDAEWNLKKTTEGHESTLEETWADYAIRSTVTAIKLPLCCVNLKKNNNKKDKCVFGKI